MKKEYGEMSWDEVERLNKKNMTIILPVGGVEEHGTHLPVETDTLIPFELAKRVAEKTNSIVLPPVTYGYMYTLRIFPGTISLKSRTLRAVIEDIVREIIRNGFKKILVLNGHGGNSSIITNALKELADELKFRACVVEWWRIKELGAEAGHADETEASLYACFKPRLVKTKVKQEKYRNIFGSVVPLPQGVFSKSGYMGSVKNISKKKGEKMAKIIVEKLVKLIKSDLVLEEKE